MTPALCSLPKDRVAEILRAVSKQHGVPVPAIVGAQRHAATVRARHVAMFLTRRLTKLSLAATGRRFGDRRSATVIYACKKVGQLVENAEIAGDIHAVLDALGLPALPLASPTAVTKGSEK